MTVEYFARNVYGKRTLYVVDGDIQNAISTLTGKRTVNESDLRALSELGVEAKQVFDPER